MTAIAARSADLTLASHFLADFFQAWSAYEDGPGFDPTAPQPYDISLMASTDKPEPVDEQLVERVARAIAAGRGLDPDKCTMAWSEEDSRPTWKCFEAQARDLVAAAVALFPDRPTAER